MAFITGTFPCLWSYLQSFWENLHTTLLPREMWKQGKGNVLFHLWLALFFSQSLDMTWMVSVVLITKRFCSDKLWQYWMFIQWIMCKSLETAKLSQITSCLWDVKYCNSCFWLSHIPWKTFSLLFCNILTPGVIQEMQNPQMWERAVLNNTLNVC